MVDGSVNIEVGGTFELTIGGNGLGIFVVFNTGGGKMYFILGGQHGIFVVVAGGVVVVVIFYQYPNLLQETLQIAIVVMF
jgi:hypothetical protein